MTDTARLNELVRDLTAFVSLDDMIESMKNGYVPTLRNISEDRAELARGLVAMGFTVWGLNGKNWN